MAATGQGVGSLQPSWSPDGERILFLSDHQGDVFVLYAVGPDGEDRQVANASGTEVSDPVWG